MVFSQLSMRVVHLTHSRCDATRHHLHRQSPTPTQSNTMRTAALLVCALMAAQAHGYSQEYVRANSKLLWRAFKNDHGKRYTSQAEEDHRYGVFTSNMLKAARFEKEQTKGARFGSNVFSDLSAEEFKAYHSLQVPQKASPPPMFSAEEVKAAAGSVDWRVKGAGNTLTSVSEQELVSCDMVDNGCNGGLMDNAFKWLLDNHNGQIVMEESYPYASGQGTRYSCQDVSSMTVGATISSYKDITHSEEQMKAFVSTSGPLPIAVDATKWQTYTGGILTDCCGYSGCQLDHGVLIVGYGEDYWIVKNSWGPSWGESGYIRVGYGNNECGITGSPCAPVV